jgi:hypothetical protein
MSHLYRNSAVERSFLAQFAHQEHRTTFDFTYGLEESILSTEAVLPRSGVNFTRIAQKWPTIEGSSQGCLQQSIDSGRYSRGTSAVLVCELDAYGPDASGWCRDAESKSGAIAALA